MPEYVTTSNTIQKHIQTWGKASPKPGQPMSHPSLVPHKIKSNTILLTWQAPLATALRYEAISVCSSVKTEDDEDTGSTDDSGPSARGDQNEGETLEQPRPLTTTSLCIIKMHCIYMFVDPRQEGIRVSTLRASHRILLRLHSVLRNTTSVRSQIMDSGPTLQHRAHMFRLGPRDHECHINREP